MAPLPRLTYSRGARAAGRGPPLGWRMLGEVNLNSDPFRAQLGAPELIELYDYWVARRGSRPMPSRADVNPAEIPRHLQNLMLVDVLPGEPIRFRYRLVGTRVVAATGENRTGRLFHEVRFFELYPNMMEQYQQVVREARPFFSSEPFHSDVKGTAYEVERLMLPFAAEGDRPDLLLVYFNFKSGPFTGR